MWTMATSIVASSSSSFPESFELARFWGNELKRPIVVVTNQSGIGRGYFDESAYADLTRWMCDALKQNARQLLASITAHHPGHGIGEYRCDHPWRKPNPGMILQAASDLGLDLPRSAIVGDKISDMEAGAAAGIGLRIRIGSPNCGDARCYELVANIPEALALLRHHVPIC